MYGCVCCFQVWIFKVHIHLQVAPGSDIQYSDWATAWRDWSSNSGMPKTFFLFSKTAVSAVGSIRLPIQRGYLVSFHTVNQLGPDIDYHLFLAQRFRISGNPLSIHQCTHVWRYGPLWALGPLRILLYPPLVSTNLVFAFLLVQLSSIWNCIYVFPICLRGRYAFTFTDFIHIYVINIVKFMF